LPGRAPRDGPPHCADVGYAAGLRHPARGLGRGGRRLVRAHQGRYQADPHDAAELDALRGGGGPEGAPARRVRGGDLPGAGGLARDTGQLQHPGREREPVPAGSAPVARLPRGRGAFTRRPPHPGWLSRRVRRVDVIRHVDPPLERGIRRHQWIAQDVHVRPARAARRPEAPHQGRRLRGGAGPQPALPPAGAARARRSARRGRPRCRDFRGRHPQRRRPRGRPRPPRLTPPSPPVATKRRRLMAWHRNPLHPSLPPVRRMADHPGEALLRAEAEAVALENAELRDRYRGLTELEEQQQERRGVTRRTFFAGVAATMTALATSQFVATRAAFGAAPGGTLIHVFLYGGLDGLALVAPADDGYLRTHRPDLVLPDEGSIPIARNFKLTGAFAPRSEEHTS